MSEYDDTNRGALFKADKKSDKHPDYTGPFMQADGTEGFMSAWLRTSAGGKKYMSLSWTKKGEFGEKAQEAGYENTGEIDDEIPF